MACFNMHNEVPIFQSWTPALRFVVYSVTICALFVTVWTLFPMPSHESIVTLALPSDLIVQGVYKYAYENADGTIDLVFNIPRGGSALMQLKLNNSEDATESLNDGTTEGAKTTEVSYRIQSQSYYPISLDCNYVINSIHICPEGQRVDYIILVHSATAYFQRRKVIRESYGGKRVLGNMFQRVVFLLGTTVDPLTTRSIQDEAFLHRDIVQGAFVDSYHNLTHKGVLGIRWVTEHCPQAKFIVKIDDDVFLNPFKLVKEILPSYANKTRHIACHLRPGGTSPIGRGKGKWQVHEDEFKGQAAYPFDYCNGYFVIMSNDLIRPMLNAVRLNPYFWIDDVYMFGILPATVGNTSFTNIDHLLCLSYNVGKKCYARNGSSCKFLAVSQWKPAEQEALWYMLLYSLTNSFKKELNIFGLSK